MKTKIVITLISLLLSAGCAHNPKPGSGGEEIKHSEMKADAEQAEREREAEEAKRKAEEERLKARQQGEREREAEQILKDIRRQDNAARRDQRHSETIVEEFKKLKRLGAHVEDHKIYVKHTQLVSYYRSTDVALNEKKPLQTRLAEAKKALDIATRYFPTQDKERKLIKQIEQQISIEKLEKLLAHIERKLKSTLPTEQYLNSLNKYWGHSKRDIRAGLGKENQSFLESLRLYDDCLQGKVSSCQTLLKRPGKNTQRLSAYAQERLDSIASFDLESYYKKNFSQSDQELLQKFPYKKYLQEVSFINFKILQNHRNYLNRERGIGDDFLYYLGENFINLYPVSLQQLKAKIKIGEAYINPSNKQISRRANEAYEIIGYYILGKVARKIEHAIKNDNFDPTKLELIKRLEGNRTYISIEQSTSKKFFTNLKQGNFGYIFDRVGKKITEFFSDEDEEIRSLKLYDYKKYYPIGKGNHAINILIVKKDNTPIGYSIWLKRPDIKAKYFAYKTARQTVAQKYHRWVAVQNKKVVLATSGGFTNSYSQPEGLTVESGNIVNGVLMPDRHGLVIVEKSGGIRVINLKRQTVKLPIAQGKVFKLNPNKSLIDYSKLLRWCKEHKATLFQTQLLAFSDKLLISHKKAKPQLRERRILALVLDKKTNQLYHVIFHIPQSYNLAVLSKEIYDTLARHKQKIEAMLNFDVGSYNILNVFDNKGHLNSAIVGPVNIDSATNLIVYTRN